MSARAPWRERLDRWLVRRWWLPHGVHSRISIRLLREIFDDGARQ